MILPIFMTLSVEGSTVSVHLNEGRCLTEAAGLMSVARRGTFVMLYLFDGRDRYEWTARTSGRIGRAEYTQRLRDE